MQNFNKQYQVKGCEVAEAVFQPFLCKGLLYSYVKDQTMTLQTVLKMV